MILETKEASMEARIPNNGIKVYAWVDFMSPKGEEKVVSLFHHNEGMIVQDHENLEEFVKSTGVKDLSDIDFIKVEVRVHDAFEKYSGKALERNEISVHHEK